MPQFNLFLVLEYLGTAYAGSQIQKNSITIQELLDKALSRLFAIKTVKTIFTGRTDSGVHACAQGAAVLVPKAVPAAKVLAALNSMLPPDIRVVSAEYKDLGFQPRYAAVSREYLYNIYCAEKPLLYLQDRVWHLAKHLNIGAMRKAAKLFKGRRDFSAFCAAGSAAQSKVRRVMVSELRAQKVPAWPGARQKAEGLLLTYRIKAEGFLYHQVRNIAAALVDVGLGKLTTADLQAIMSAGTRSALRSPTAPAAGLVLYAVKYGKRR